MFTREVGILSRFRASSGTTAQRRVAPRLRRVGLIGLGGLIVGGLALSASTPVLATTVTVTDLSGDAGVAGSLPKLVADATSGDVIIFQAGLIGTITLNTVLIIDKNLTIIGPGVADIEITRTTGTIISVSSGDSLDISGVEISDSSAGNSAVQLNSAAASSFTDMLFSDNALGIVANTTAGVTVTDSEFSGTAGRAIDLEDTTPVVIGGVAGTEINNSMSATPFGDGIFIDNAGSATITNVDVSGVDTGLRVIGDNDDMTAENLTVTGSDFSDNTGGISVSGTDGFVSVTNTTVTDTVSGGFGSGVSITTSGGVGLVTLDTVVVTGSGNSAIRVNDATGVSATDLTITSNPGGGAEFNTISGGVTITGGNFDNNGSGISVNGVTGTTAIAGVTASDNTNNGISAFTTADVTITGPTVVDGNSLRGVDMQSVGNISITGATVTANDDGLFVKNAGSVTIVGSTFDDQVDEGIGMTGEFGNVSMSTTNIRGNGASGLRITRQSTLPTTATTSITGSTITGNTSTGLQLADLALASANKSTGMWTVADSTVSNNSTGVSADTFGATLVIDDVVMDANPVGVDVDTAAGVTVSDSRFTGHAGRAIDLAIPGVVSITNTDVENDGTASKTGLGVFINDPDSLTIDDLSITDQNSGALLVLGDNNDLTFEPVTITNGVFSGNTGGPSIAGTDGPVSVTSTTISANGGNGINISTAGVVTLNTVAATGNGSTGISVGPATSVTGTNVTSSTNGGGITFSNISGNTAITTGTVVDNTGSGITVSSVAGTASFTGFTITGHSLRGIQSFGTSGGVTVIDSTVTGNTGGIELTVPGVVIVTNVDASNNVGVGLKTETATSVTVTDSTFDNTTADTGLDDGSGVSFNATTGAVSIVDSFVRGNAAEGIEINRAVAGSAVTTSIDIDNTVITGNVGEGVEFKKVAGLLTIDGSTIGANPVGVLGTDSGAVSIIDTAPFSDHTGRAIDISSSGAITLDGVDVNEGAQPAPSGLGVHLDNVDAVTINDTTIVNQNSLGLFIDGTPGAAVPVPVSIGTTTVTGNAGGGISITNALGAVSVTGPSVTSSNGDDGLVLVDVGAASVAGLIANSNNGVGISVGDAVSFSTTGTSATLNDEVGLGVSGSGDISIAGGSFGSNGVVVDSHGVGLNNNSGTISVAGVAMSSNPLNGLDIDTSISGGAAMGNITITGPTVASNNGERGVYINVPRFGEPVFPGPTVSISGVTATGHTFDGLLVLRSADVTIATSTFDDNDFDGANITDATGIVAISSSSFDNNDDDGLVVVGNNGRENSGITLNAVTADDNGGSGATLFSDGEITITNGSSMSRNGPPLPGIFDNGLEVGSATVLRLENSAFDDNTRNGINASSVNSIVSTNSTFDRNDRTGLENLDFASATITGGSASGNDVVGLDLGGFGGSGSGTVVIDDVDVLDNPAGVDIRNTTGATIIDSVLAGHTLPAIVVSNSGAVVIERTTVGNGAALVSTGTGVAISTVASVAIDDLDITDQVSSGLRIGPVSGGVAVENSTLSGNGPHGLEVTDVTGSVAVSSTTASNNVAGGINGARTGPFSISETTTNDNGFSGVALSTTGAATVTSLVANDNGAGGLAIGTASGPVTVTGATTERNESIGVQVLGTAGPTKVLNSRSASNAFDGIRLDDVGNVEVSGTVVDDNGGEGIRIANAGTVTVAGSIITDSDGDGLSIFVTGPVTISGSRIERNTGTSPSFGYGAQLEQVTGSVAVSDSIFRSNASDGLDVRNAGGGVGNITVDGSTFSLNVGVGASLGRFGDPAVGNIAVDSSSFVDNGETGLSIGDAGNVTLASVTAEKNFLTGGIGATDPNPASDVGGVSTRAIGDLTVVNPQIVGNGARGIVVPSAGAVGISGGQVSNNAGTGLTTLDSGALSVSSVSIESNGGSGASLNAASTVSIDSVTVRLNVSGGMSIASATGRVDVANSTFSDHAETGLSVIASSGPVEVVNTDFSKNRVGANLSNITGSSRFEQTSFTPDGANTTGIASNGLGGLAVVDSTFADLSNSVASRNIAGDVIIDSSSFERSSNKSLEFIDMVGNFSFTDSSVINNRAGLILTNVDGSATIDRSTFTGSGGAAGLVEFPANVVAVTDVSGGLDVVNSSFFGNENAYAIDAAGTAMTVRHSTLAKNGDRSPIRTDADIAIDHSIVLPAFDEGVPIPSPSVELVTPPTGPAPTATATFSLQGSGLSLGATNIRGGDPLLAPAALNGGTTLSLAPLADSPVVEAGNPNISGQPATDQTGGARIQDVIDIGSVEFDIDRPEPPPPPAPVSLIESLAPERFADTRPAGQTNDGQFLADGRVVPGGEYRVRIAGRGQVPADAEGVVMNITAIGVDGTGFITAHPCITPRPLASSLNYTAGVNLGNEIVAGLSESGDICLFSSQGTHLTVDVTGYVPAGSEVTPITPRRYMDTRPGQTTFDDIGNPGAKLEAGSNTILLMSSRGEIPFTSDNPVSAVIVNVTAIGAEGPGFVTIHPCLDQPPLASSLNYVAGVNRGNELVASLDRGGRICIFTSATTHLSVDVVGYIPADTDLNPVDPARLLDTRPGQVTVDGEGAGDGKVTAGGSSTLQVGGRGNVPDDAKAVIVNVTAIGPESVGFVTVHPCLDPAPNASSLNYVPGVNGGNEIIALLSDDGKICLFTSATTHLAVDVVAYLE